MRLRRRSPLLLFTMIVALLAIPVHLALGVEHIPADDGTEASRMTWPDGADLLAAVELDLPAGGYDWQVTTLTLTQTDTAFTSGNGIIVTASGAAIIQLNGRDTVRLERNSALTMANGDRWQARAADNDPAIVLVAELLPDWAPRSDDDVSIIGTLDVPGGAATMVLVNLDKDLASDDARDEVMRGALRPGISIRHDETGIPETSEPDQTYDRWVIALFAHGGEQIVPIVTGPPSTPMPVASPTVPATPPATATSPATPPVPTATMMPTDASTPAPSPTPSPTATATVTPTPSPTATATVTPTPSPTATATVTPTPSPTPTLAPTATDVPSSGDDDDVPPEEQDESDTSGMIETVMG